MQLPMVGRPLWSPGDKVLSLRKKTQQELNAGISHIRVVCVQVNYFEFFCLR